MTPLLLLAEKVEGLEGPDREVDGSIWWATRSLQDIERLDPSGFVRRCIKSDGSAGIALQQFFDSSNPVCLARLAFQERHTASLDSAMSLVPEGWYWSIKQYPRVGCVADIGGIHTSKAHTPALALCAAALRARAAMEAGE